VECLSIHLSLLFARVTSARDPANPAQTVLLPNGNILPTAGTSAESSKEISPCRTGFVTKLGPQISLFPVPIFGVNICPFNYGIKWFYSEIDYKRQRLQVKSVQHLFFLPAIQRSLRSDPNPRSSFPQAQIFNGGSKSSCSGKFHPFKTHSALFFSIPTSDFFFRHFLVGAFHRAFDSHWGQLNILFPRSCGNFWSPRVYWSRIQENPLQSGFMRVSSVARCFQELAFTPNRRLEKLV
jgi:hypothetical protein